MANIGDLNEAWAGHSGLEVETFIKSQLMQVNQKFGYAEFNTQTTSIVFYDEEGGSPVFTLSLGGEIYDIVLNANVDPVFYVLADETEKIITFTPRSTLSYFGDTSVSDFPERHTYIVYVDTGSGYEAKTSGRLEVGETASVDVKQLLVRGNNYVRISVTGETSGKTKSFIFTATLTSLYLSCSHTWQSLWREGNDYVINGIHFAGNLVKYLRVTMTVNGTTIELPRVEYRANQSYTTTATTYTIQADKFPNVEDNCIASITIWMEAQGISTPSVSYNIMCVKQASTTSLIAINDVVSPAVNYTSGRIFSYAVYLADSATFNMTALVGGNTYPATTQPVVVEELETGRKYDFTYSLEVDTGVDEAGFGSLTAVGIPYANGVSGLAFSTTTRLDNSFSYPSTPGSLFYMNAAMRSNEEAEYDIIKNEAGRSSDNNFAASYTATWSGISWARDGWSSSDADNAKALVIPAGSSVTFNDFAPLSYISSYQSGMTIEMLVKCGYPSGYSTPVFEMSSGSPNPIGLFIYPTKITVIGSNESDEIKQSVMLSENTITHIVVTFTRDYENVSTRNLCSIYVNGISNVNFAFDGGSSFGNGNLRIGHPDTDAYLYKMRVYGTALDSNAVLNNFLNSIMLGSGYDRRDVFNKNQVIDVEGVDYPSVKRAGFNTMVITMTDDETPIPSIDNPAPDDGFQDCSIDFEYAGHPSWNVNVANVSIDGQGTTSKRYFRWNIRAKTSGSTVWSYGDGTSADGKVGKFINTAGYADVDRITAKKNIASSMQGHKMGMTGLYNDIFKQLGLGSHIPDADYQVAVYQFPFVGFRKYSDNTYEYIGLYTAGPDKGSKVTFGYDGNEYPNLMSLEGPDHDPLATRFLHPWIDVDYSYEDETLTFGGEQGWDCDAIGGGLKTDKSSDAASVLALYESEWKPAYELVYHCSPYIASLSDALSESGYASISAINADVANFRKGSTGGVSNALLSFYDSSYDIWFYETKEGEYANLSTLEESSDHNVKTYLGLTGNPTTAQIIAARAAKFKSEATSYWDIDQTLYHYCYCVFFGVTDNFAKNSYPVKFRGFNETLEEGESVYCKRWGWRQDDLDTILATDNNGRNTKPYYVEHGDVNAYGNELFQGGESALWVLVRDNYGEEIRQMMSSMISAMDSIATRNGRTSGDLHDRIFSVVSLYCWEKSAKYFSQLLYESDRRWSYIEPWLINATKEYNNVHPLDQALGDEYLAEQLWVERRIVYMFSKYRIGAFSGKETGYGGLSITLAEQFEFDFTPAISLYPVASVSETDYPLGTYSPNSMRVNEGESQTIVLPAGGATNNYLHGLDWMSSIGDLSGMVLTDRSTGETISFSIQSERLQELKVGDEDPNNVLFNARSLFVKSPSLVSIDARYTSTVRNLVNLMECPRLRTCLFEGSMARGLYLPVGAKLTEVSFPAEASSIFLHSLPFLTEEGLTLPSLPLIQMLYINNCQSLAPFSIVEDILATVGNSLSYVTIAWRGVVDGSISTLLALTELDGYVAFDNDTPTNVGGKPRIEGSVRVGNLYIDELETLNIVSEEVYQQTLTRALSNLFGTNLYIIYDPNTLWIRFADPNVETICMMWDTNHDGYLTVNEAKAVTTIGTYFSNNTTITSFDEFKYFTGVRTLGNNQASAVAFAGCINLESVILPEGLTFIDGTSSSGAFVNGITFRNCSSLERIGFPSTLQRVGGEGGRGYVFIGCSKLGRIDIVDLAAYFRITFENIRSNPFYDDSTAATRGLYLNGELITNLVVPSDVTEIKANSFYRNNTITSVDIHAGVTKIGEYAFNYCSSVRSFIVRATTPPNIVAMNALTNMFSFKIYVPYSSDHSVLDSYKSGSGWKSFSSKIYELDQNGNIPI